MAFPRGRPAPLLLLILLLLLLSPILWAGEIQRPVLADTWIDGLASASVHGSESALGICPVANYWIYLKFDVANTGCAVTDAELRLTRIDGARPEEIAAYRITEDGWTEATLIGTNRPAPTNPGPATSIAIGQAATGYDRFRSAALLDVVREEVAGDGVLSIMLRENEAPMFDIRHYRSREAAVPAANRPLLVLQGDAPQVALLRIAKQPQPTLVWIAGPAGSVYDVAWGTLAALRVDGGVDAAQCLADDLAVPSFSDPLADPVLGAGRYYIVRLRNACGTGSYGMATSGAERLPIAACP